MGIFRGSARRLHENHKEVRKFYASIARWNLSRINKLRDDISIRTENCEAQLGTRGKRSLGSLSPSFDEPCHVANGQYGNQDRHPYAVTTHPTDAPHATIHHVFVLRRNRRARSQMRWTRRGTSAIWATRSKLRRHHAAVCATTHARNLRLLFDQQSGKARRGTMRSGRRAEHQTAAPNSLPTPAVIAIASAPQKVTR